MPVGTSGGLPGFQFFIKSTPDALPKAGFSQMAGLGGLSFFGVWWWEYDFNSSIFRAQNWDFFFWISISSSQQKGKSNLRNEKKYRRWGGLILKTQKKMLVKEKINFKN